MRGAMKTRTYAIVAFGAESRRPTIICIDEAAMPEACGPDWLVLARDSTILAPSPASSPPARSGERLA